MFKDYFDIYVVVVSGQEEIYKNDQHGSNIEVSSGNDKKEKYIIY